MYIVYPQIRYKNVTPRFCHFVSSQTTLLCCADGQAPKTQTMGKIYDIYDIATWISSMISQSGKKIETSNMQPQVTLCITEGKMYDILDTHAARRTARGVQGKRVMNTIDLDFVKLSKDQRL